MTLPNIATLQNKIETQERDGIAMQILIAMLQNPSTIPTVSHVNMAFQLAEHFLHMSSGQQE